MLTISATLLLMPAPAGAQAGTLGARIKIDTDRVVGPIDNLIYGNFIEHLGRCIEGGSVSGKLARFRTPTATAKMSSRPSKVCRFRSCAGQAVTSLPATTGKTGLVREISVQPRLELAWGTTESNRFGTHEFLNYCEMLGTQPYICVNLGTGSWDEAKFWVEYCNLQGGTRYSDLREEKWPREALGGHLLGIGK